VSPSERSASVVRFTHEDQSGASFGSGVLVSPSTILTARHVVDPRGASNTGRTVDGRALRVQGAAFGIGTVTVDELRFPTDGSIDLAVAILRPPKLASIDACCALPTDLTSAVNVGDEVTLMGLSRHDGPVEQDDLRVQSFHGNAGVFVCNRSVPRGFSGGPVFSGALLVGITYARNHDQGQSYFYSGHELARLVEDCAAGEIKREAVEGHALRRYPLGPAMSPNEVAARLSNFIAKCVSMIGAQQSKVTVARANQMRLACGPDTGTKGLIEIAFLREPALDLYGFWFDAFMVATSKSPRMLAALLLSIDDDSFTANERAEKADVLTRLQRVAG
jgi:V8-like Glu-specific endopeptidase